MEIALDRLPIPDWGLECPRCRYPLRGLPGYRCPECGTQFDITTLIHPWTRLRPPRFTGNEMPFPDFGLMCRACKQPLAGARQFACPACGTFFDPQAERPAKDWFLLDSRSSAPLPILGVQAVLAEEKVPYIPAGERGPVEIVLGHGPLFERLRIATEFYFEVLWLLEAEKAELRHVREHPMPGWRCSGCGEANPGHFDLCWNCERVRTGEEPADTAEPEAEAE